MLKALKENWHKQVVQRISVVHALVGIFSSIFIMGIGFWFETDDPLTGVYFGLFCLALFLSALSVYVDDWVGYRKALRIGVDAEGRCLDIQRREHVISFVILYKITYKFRDKNGQEHHIKDEALNDVLGELYTNLPLNQVPLLPIKYDPSNPNFARVDRKLLRERVETIHDRLKQQQINLKKRKKAKKYRL